MANGYILAGNVRGEGTSLAVRMIRSLFCTAPKDGSPCGECTACRHVADRVNPDVHWLFPESKSRVISVDSMRGEMLDPMSSTSFAGGWKVGVLAFADCMNASSANAFLKLLEEPPKRTMFLLLTDAANRLLPTIVSRCQTLEVSDGSRPGLAGDRERQVLDIVADPNLRGVVERCAAAAKLAAVLKEMSLEAEKLVDAELEAKEESATAEETSKNIRAALGASRYREMRLDLIHTVLGWFRDLMAVKAGGPDVPVANAGRLEVLKERAARVTLAQCIRNVEAVEEFADALGRNLQEEPLLSRMMDRIAFGTEGVS